MPKTGVISDQHGVLSTIINAPESLAFSNRVGFVDASKELQKHVVILRHLYSHTGGGNAYSQLVNAIKPKPILGIGLLLYITSIQTVDHEEWPEAELQFSLE